MNRIAVISTFASVLLLAGAASAQTKAPEPAKAAPAAKSAAPAAKSACLPLKDTPTVKLHTSMGVITVELDKEKAPLSTVNFVKYVDSGFYNGTIFHRVMNNFMIQGGGFTKDFAQKPTLDPVKNEASNGLKNDNYTIAMARTPMPHSATSQFFINVKNNDGLNYPGQDGWGYAVFGKVTAGQEVVDKIKAVPTSAKNPGHPHAPVDTVVIEKAECV
jgi:peptidyl-prolyl cis-trans isomerase A (cyclophilin A)